ncbi:Glycine/D-amino acid oxidase (deaminating) [Apibacter mensalis]|uniref:Glycine/D-amino acid oxidase (Deaminating) n=1 Tax=Apibacter mensalis TaxID=1586267 RepID=A0A0X3ART0_9FLAO|nr:FAD-dependent oxidoreductase [Apibacter mensalis]CVK16943.1 Glycine/D-amino acid oxidase (deaminating) [Apibacter mensalis]
MLDYLIIGQGLAGSCLAHRLLKENKSYKIIDIVSNSASFVSSGMYNPVVLKRFTPVWNAEIEINKLLKEFKDFEILLKVKLIYNSDLYRIFANEDEVRTWKKKSERNENLKPFLDPEIYDSVNPNIIANFGMGKVYKSGKIFVRELLREFRKFLLKDNRLIDDIFDFNHLNKEINYYEYKGIKTKKIVFCDGYSLKYNPYFNYLPMEGVKGETMVIHANGLGLTDIVKSKVFIMPMDKDYYYIGATYHYREVNDEISEEGQNELINSLNKFLNIDYKIVKKFAGIRPTVVDRRPLLGEHPEFKNMFIFNGLGSRGVMLAPIMAEELYHFMENSKELLSEVSIKRFNL